MPAQVRVIINRNGPGLGLDLKQSDGKRGFLALLATADVLIERFRPGTKERLGLGYAEIEKINPRSAVASCPADHWQRRPASDHQTHSFQRRHARSACNA